MENIFKAVKNLISVLFEELDELDRRTDFTQVILRSVNLNDDYEEELEEGDEPIHFGVVRITLALGMLWAFNAAAILLLP